MSFLWFLARRRSWSTVLLSRTNFGNWVRATGGFLPAAQSMGIPTARVKIACFMICSVLAGFAGTIQVMRLGAPLPSIGEGLELQAVAAAVIGGTSLAGGIGTIFGGIIGAPLIRVIDNGLVLSQVDANWFKLAIGFLTIFAVVGERLAAQARRARSRWRPDHGGADHRNPQSAQMVFRRPRAEERRRSTSIRTRRSAWSATTAPASRR